MNEFFRIAPEFDEYTAMAEAIELSASIKAELAERVPGALRSYVVHAKKDAVEAMAGLITAHPDDAAEQLRCKNIIAAYTGVMAWIKGSLDGGDAAIEDWTVLQQNQLEDNE